MLEWGRACCSRGYNTRYGGRTERYKLLQRARHCADANVWIDAPINETLIGIENNRAKRRSIEISANITIASWLDDQQKLRAKVKVKRRRATNILRAFLTEDAMREANNRIHRKIQVAREELRYKRGSRKLGNNPMIR